jgi:hypothetical protein
LFITFADKFSHFLQNFLSNTSSSLITLLPVLDGTNYPAWADQMEPFLHSQKLWSLMDGWFDKLVNAHYTNQAELADVLSKWADLNDQALGTMVLRINPMLHHHKKDSAKETWEALKAEFAIQKAPSIFADVKAAISFKLTGGDPHPEINEL